MVQCAWLGGTRPPDPGCWVDDEVELVLGKAGWSAALPKIAPPTACLSLYLLDTGTAKIAHTYWPMLLRC